MQCAQKGTYQDRYVRVFRTDVQANPHLGLVTWPLFISTTLSETSSEMSILNGRNTAASRFGVSS